MMLGTQDLELIDLTCDTASDHDQQHRLVEWLNHDLQFIMFSKYHDGSTLGVDAEFTTDFESLIKKFADLCENTNGDPNTQLR